jgi:hypothetical protein
MYLHVCVCVCVCVRALSPAFRLFAQLHPLLFTFLHTVDQIAQVIVCCIPREKERERERVRERELPEV